MSWVARGARARHARSAVRPSDVVLPGRCAGKAAVSLGGTLRVRASRTGRLHCRQPIMPGTWCSATVPERAWSEWEIGAEPSKTRDFKKFAKRSKLLKKFN